VVRATGRYRDMYERRRHSEKVGWEEVGENEFLFLLPSFLPSFLLSLPSHMSKRLNYAIRYM